MTIQKPELNPTFFYGPIIFHEFNGDISKDKGKYRIRFTLTFKSGDVYRTQKSGYLTESEARRGKELLITQLVRNEYIPFDYTAKELFDYWLYYHMIEENAIRYNTFQIHRNVLYNHILPFLGEKKKISAISIDDLVKAIQRIPFPSVKEQSVKTLRLLFQFAYQKRYITFNPCIAAIKIVKKEITIQTPRKVIPYTIGQIRMLLYNCKQNFSEMYMPLLLSLTIGTRISETIGLTYSDIDFTSKYIYIHRQLGRNINDDSEQNLVTQRLDTKTTNAIRYIPVPDWVIDEILVRRAWYEKQRRMIPSFCDMDYICCKCNGKPFNRKHFTNDFHKLTSMCGLQNIHWHDLRHIYASVLKNNSVNMKAVSEFLGHSSPNFTEDVYVYQDETAYDCSMLSEVWENIRPKVDEELGYNHQFIPLTDEDYMSFMT